MRVRRLCHVVLAALLAACGEGSGDATQSGSDLAQAARPPGRAASVRPPEAPAPALSLVVTPSRGQLTGRIALPALPLRAGFDPELAIAYDGSNVDFGEGVGAGMSLTVPSITTSPEYGLTLPRGTGADPLVMPLVYQGRRLMFVPGGNENVPEYRLEASESPTRLFYHRTTTDLEVHDRTLKFQGILVVHADGSREIYSEEQGIAESDTFPAGGRSVPVVTRFPLRYRIAPSGDVIEYRYTRIAIDNRSYLTSVIFAGGLARYDFELDALREPPQRSVFVQGFEQRQTHLYTRVTGWFDGEVIHRTYFVYRTATKDAPALLAHVDVADVAAAELGGRVAGSVPLVEESVLLAVLRYGAGEGPVAASSERMPTVRFAYADRTFEDLRTQTSVATLDITGVQGFGAESGGEYLDVDQDGLIDVVASDALKRTTTIYANRGDGSFRPAEGSLQVSRASEGAPVVPMFQGDASTWLPGDFDGDGVVDLLQVEGTADGSALTLYPGQVAGTAHFAPARASYSSRRALASFADGNAQVADLNADGRDDLLIAERKEGAWRFSLLLNRTKSEGLKDGGQLHFQEFDGRFETPALFNEPVNGNQDFRLSRPENRLSDVNGDGLVDLTVVRASTDGDKGVCVFENQGKIRVNVDSPSNPVAKDLLLFGEDNVDPICAGGYFLEITGLLDLDTINALWLVDVTGDGLADLVNLGKTLTSVLVWAGRGRDGFRYLGEIQLPSEPLRVDANNRWNTRVLDIDGDGQEEITVYDPNQRDALRVIDFNRVGDLNLTPPLLLEEVSEGKGVRHRVQFTTSTPEMLRDRRHERPDARGVPFVMPVVKRLVTQVGAAAPSVNEYRYHAPAANLVERGLLGFGEVEVASYGDGDAAHALTRITYTRSGDRYLDRLLGDRESGREVRPLALDDDARATLAAVDQARGAGTLSLPPLSKSEARREQAAPLVATSSEWVSDGLPDAARTPRYLREAATTSVLYGEGCADAACAARVRRETSFDGCNRPVRELYTQSSVAGPGPGLPQRSETTTTTYLKACEEAARRTPQPIALASVRSVVRESARKRLLESRELAYDEGDFAPSAVTTTASIDVSAMPPPIQSAITPVPSRTLRYVYDPYLNLRESRDEVGVIERRSYDAAGVRVETVTNGRGHVQRLHYAKGTLGPTQIDTPRGDILRLRYDALQRLESSTQQDGTTTYYAYREPEAIATRRVLVSQRRSDSETSATLYVARADGQPVARIEPADGGGARVLELRDWGRRDRVIRAWVPAIVPTSIADLLAASADDAWQPPGDAGCRAGRVDCFHYDAVGRPVQRLAASGKLDERVAYPPWGRTFRVIDQGVARTRQEVARDDRVYAVVDELGEIHRFARDEADMLTAVHLAQEETPRASLADSLGRVLYAAVPHGMSKVFTRDARGRVEREQIFDRQGIAGGSIATRYDELDRPLERTQHGAQGASDKLDHTRFVYDEREDGDLRSQGSLVRAETEDLLALSRFEAKLEHDRDGRITARSVVYHDGDVRRSYDEAWEYSFDGLLTAYSDPHGQQFAYALAASGEPASITWLKGTDASVLMRATALDAHGLATARERPAQRLIEEAAYDAASGLLLKRRSCLAGHSPCLQDDTWTRRGDGKVIERQGPGLLARYTYTARGELAEASAGSVLLAYQIDPAGHLLQAGDVPGGQLLRGQSPVALPAEDEVDTFGRVVRSGAARRIAYDPSGRVRSVELDGKRIVYVYGPDGARVARKVDGSDALTVYPTPRARDDGRERQSLISDKGEPLALVVDGRATFALITDHRGVVESVVDAAGKRVGSFAWTPYGQLTDGSSASIAGIGSLELVRSFTGSLRDDDTGIVHMGARSYLPSAASFATPDPLVQSRPELCSTRVLECMPYGYVAHDPINLVDPTGTSAVRSAIRRIARFARRTVQKMAGRGGSGEAPAGLVGNVIGRTSSDSDEIASRISGLEMNANDALVATRAALSAAGPRGTRVRTTSAGDDGMVVTTAEDGNGQEVLLVRQNGQVERMQADVTIEANGNLTVSSLRPRTPEPPTP